MASFSENQVRHVYVANASGTVASTSANGTIEVGADSAKTGLYFKYKSPGGIVRSDLIPISNIISGKATDADSLKIALKKYLVTLNSSVNSGSPVSGQDYILRIAFRNFIGLSVEDQYFKYGQVKATSGMTASDFYDALYTNLVKNFSKEASDLIKFSKQKSLTVTNQYKLVSAVPGYDTIKYTLDIAASTAGVTKTVSGTTITYAIGVLTGAKTIGDLISVISSSSYASEIQASISGTATTATTISAAVSSATSLSTYDGIAVEESESYWKLGTFQQSRVDFTVQPLTIVYNSDEYIWGTVTSETSTTSLRNGKITADLEYFALGERGDIYRNLSFPNSFSPTYLVDSSKSYNYIDITYFYQGDNESVQKSQKSITLVVPKVGATNSVSNALTNTIIGAINTAAGTSIATLSV